VLNLVHIDVKFTLHVLASQYLPVFRAFWVVYVTASTQFLVIALSLAILKVLTSLRVHQLYFATMINCTFVPLSKYDWSLHPALIPVALPWNPTVYCLITAFCAVSSWMTVELTLQVFFTFKRHKSLYFWSILICTWGVSFQVIGLILKLFNYGSWILSSIFFKIGWVGNVTGFSFVLYSRLNLVVRNRKILRAVLIMIITDAFLLHTPIIIFDFGISSPHPDIWFMPMYIMEKIQVTWFSVQETIISLLYIYHTRDFLKDTYTHQTHRVMQLLMTAQVLAILFDVALVTVDWNNMFTLKVTIHPFVYAVKLKMEFIVLNQLLALIKHGVAPRSFPAPDEESPDTSGPTPPRTGKHVSFLSSGRTATATEDKTDPESTNDQPFIARDMEYEPREIPPTIHTDIDVISPSRVPDSNLVHSRDPASSPIVRQGFEQHMPSRSFSDPTPLTIARRDRHSDEIIAEIERHYLGRFGMNSPHRP
jgi:hypothetical protein